MPELAGLSFSWPDGTPLAAGLDLKLGNGCLTALVGASGCGKSTLLRLLAGLLEPQAGRVVRPPGEAGFVFQSPTLLPWRTVRENVALPQELGGAAAMSVAEALALVELTEHVENDHLLMTSWHSGRTPPPISHEELVERFETWSAAGAPCPSE